MATLAEVARALINGRLSSRAYTDNLLTRIRAREERIHAWAHLDPASARDHADRCDARQGEGISLGPLHGLPIGVSDTIDTGGMPTEYGSPIYAGYRPKSDADIVQRLVHAGAYVLGKTATSELGYAGNSDARNPWNPTHAAGGATAGAAAAVAAGFLHGALGVQNEGAVIVASAYCGVVGFKPGFGVLPTDGMRLFTATFDSVGCFGRSVADCALLSAALAAPGAISARVEPLRDRPTLGAIANYPWSTLEPEARTRFDATCASLQAGGATLRPIELPKAFAGVFQVHRTIMLHEAARLLRDVQDEYRRRFSKPLNSALDEGRTISGSTYGEMLARRAALTQEMRTTLEGIDALVSPAAVGAAPRHGGHVDASCALLWSLLGLPAASVPAGVVAGGLPLGLQIAGRSDDQVLRVAQWVETILGGVVSTRGE